MLRARTLLAAVVLSAALHATHGLIWFRQGQEFKYYDQVAAPPDGWQLPEFDDSTWSSGASPIGYGEATHATTTGVGNGVSLYFRTTSWIPDPSVFTWSLSMVVDDGAIVYVNGVEAWRYNMPADGVTHETTANAAVSNEANAKGPQALDSALLQPGVNYFSVEVHQSDVASSDASLTLILSGTAEDAALQALTTSRAVTPQATWSYLDTGDSPNRWFATDFDDSAWATGAAQLGFGDGDEATELQHNGNTAYFRHKFTVTADNLREWMAVAADPTVDDGAVLYLNGVPGDKRFNMPDGAVDKDTLATLTMSEPDESLPTGIPVYWAAGILVEGENVFAVEVHQASVASSDMSFDLFADGLVAPVVPSQSPGPTASPSATPTVSTSPVAAVSPSPTPTQSASASSSVEPSTTTTATPSVSTTPNLNANIGGGGGGDSGSDSDSTPVIVATVLVVAAVAAAGVGYIMYRKRKGGGAAGGKKKKKKGGKKKGAKAGATGDKVAAIQDAPKDQDKGKGKAKAKAKAKAKQEWGPGGSDRRAVQDSLHADDGGADGNAPPADFATAIAGGSGAAAPSLTTNAVVVDGGVHTNAPASRRKSPSPKSRRRSPSPQSASVAGAATGLVLDDISYRSVGESKDADSTASASTVRRAEPSALSPRHAFGDSNPPSDATGFDDTDAEVKPFVVDGGDVLPKPVSRTKPEAEHRPAEESRGRGSRSDRERERERGSRGERGSRSDRERERGSRGDRERDRGSRSDRDRSSRRDRDDRRARDAAEDASIVPSMPQDDHRRHRSRSRGAHTPKVPPPETSEPGDTTVAEVEAEELARRERRRRRKEKAREQLRAKEAAAAAARGEDPDASDSTALVPVKRPTRRSRSRGARPSSRSRSPRTTLRVGDRPVMTVRDLWATGRPASPRNAAGEWDEEDAPPAMAPPGWDPAMMGPMWPQYPGPWMYGAPPPGSPSAGGYGGPPAPGGPYGWGMPVAPPAAWQQYYRPQSTSPRQGRLDRQRKQNMAWFY